MSEMYLYFVQSDKSFTVDGTQIIVAGRNTSLCDLRLARYFQGENITGNIKTISGEHFKVYKEKMGDDFYIMDLESTNGTEVNGNPLKPNNPQRLNDGDVIRLADCDDFMIKVQMDSGPTAIIQPESGIYFDGYSRQFMVDGKPIPRTIPELEQDLLNHLYENAGKICSYQDIFYAIRNFEGNDSKVIAPVLKKLRKRLDKVSKGAGTRYIKTIQGEGLLLYDKI